MKKKVFLKKQQVHFLGTMYFFVFFLKSSYLESFEICYIFCNTIEISFCLFTYTVSTVTTPAALRESCRSSATYDLWLKAES